jgi:hypothetical protein
MKTENIIFAVLGVAVVGGGAWYLYNKYGNQTPKLSVIDQKLQDSGVRIAVMPAITANVTKQQANALTPRIIQTIA